MTTNAKVIASYILGKWTVSLFFFSLKFNFIFWFRSFNGSFYSTIIKCLSALIKNIFFQIADHFIFFFFCNDNYSFFFGLSFFLHKTNSLCIISCKFAWTDFISLKKTHRRKKQSIGFVCTFPLSAIDLK